MKILMLCLLIIPTLCQAADPWSRSDYVRQSLFISLQTLDFLQTRYITTHDDYVESNLVLGKKPKLNQIAGYNVAIMSTNTLIAHWLPAASRRNWQYLTIGIELQSVVHNTASVYGLSSNNSGCFARIFKHLAAARIAVFCAYTRV